MATGRKKLRLIQAKKGLVDGLTKVISDAAGELLTSALSGLEGESPSSSKAVVQDRHEPRSTSSAG